MNDISSLPDLPSVKAFPGSLMACIASKKGEVMLRIWDTGRIEAVNGMATNMDEAAKSFLDSVSKHLKIPDPIALKRDLSFLITFIQGKGIIFCDPNEKLELAAWIGEISRRYGIEL